MILKDYISSDEQKWYFELYEHQQPAPYLTLLHEGLGSVQQWKSWPQILHNELQMNILVYDRSGYGKSSSIKPNYPFDYLRHEAKVVFPSILKNLNIHKTHVFGHSDGATIALLSAACFPNMVNRVVSEAAHVIIENISLQGITKTKSIYEEKLKKPLTKYHGDKTDWVFYHWADTWLKPEFRDWQMKEELKVLKSPVLAIQGEDDEYGSHKQLEIIKEYCNAQTLLLKNCKHHPHFEKQDLILENLKSFLL